MNNLALFGTGFMVGAAIVTIPMHKSRAAVKECEAAHTAACAEFTQEACEDTRAAVCVESASKTRNAIWEFLNTEVKLWPKK